MRILFLFSLSLATTTMASQIPRQIQSAPPSRSRMTRSPGTTHIRPRADCEPADPANTVTSRLNNLLSSGGHGYTLSLCPNQNYLITAPIQFTAAGQEISTLGLPTDNSRAMLTVSGPTSDHGNTPAHTTAVQGCDACDGAKLRHIQINGTRMGAAPIIGGANIEMGGATTGQLIEYVHSFDPRAWSCLHLSEGGLQCSGATVQNNDIGPCGSDAFRQWADGISVACAKTVVQNNLVNTPTDGGIVLFGAPGSLVQNNTIWVETHTLLGGINLVDFAPWSGDYDGTVVQNNNIVGGLATSAPASNDSSRGTNNNDAIIKIGIAMGPRIWFGNRYLANVSHGGAVHDNRFEGAFGYAMAITSSRNFTVHNNVLAGNTTFIGSRGPNCSTLHTTPTSQPFVIEQDSVSQSSIQADFQNVQNADSLTCVLPPDGGDYWPYGGDHSGVPSVPGEPSSIDNQGGSGAGAGTGTGTSKGTKVGLGVGITFGVLSAALLAWFLRKRCLARSARPYPAWSLASKAGSEEDT